MAVLERVALGEGLPAPPAEGDLEGVPDLEGDWEGVGLRVRDWEGVLLRDGVSDGVAVRDLVAVRVPDGDGDASAEASVTHHASIERRDAGEPG